LLFFLRIDLILEVKWSVLEVVLLALGFWLMKIKLVLGKEIKIDR